MKLKINGEPIDVDVDVSTPLLWALREQLGLTGTKYSCGIGLCGACTVLVDNAAVPSCQLTMQDVAGSDVLTIEGLSQNGRLHPIQEAFVQHDALQCGFCTPGMIMSAAGLLSENDSPSEDEIRHGIEGNLCRCTGYHNIVKAVEYAAAKMRGETPPPAEVHLYNTPQQHINIVRRVADPAGSGTVGHLMLSLSGCFSIPVQERDRIRQRLDESADRVAGARTGQRIGQLKMGQPWDAVLLVLMDENYEPYEIYQAMRDDLEAFTDASSSGRAKRGAMSVARFKIIGQLVWDGVNGRRYETRKSPS